MGTSMVSNGDRGVWVHDGVGEVWLASLSTLIHGRPDTHPLLLDLSQEIEECLEGRWIVGALQYDFGSLLRDPELKTILRSLQKQVEDDWKAQAASGPLVVHREWQAAAEYALPELAMLSRLFFNPASVPMPEHIYIPGRGWKLA